MKTVKLLILTFILCLAHMGYSQDDTIPLPCKEPPVDSDSQLKLRTLGTADLEPWYPESGEFVIPVVFHVFGNDFYGNDLRLSEIQEGLDLTNKDFQGLTSDFKTVMSQFEDIKLGLQVKFKLAKKDPNGNPTSGVQFHGLEAGFGNHIGYNEKIQRYAWDNKKYMNVYVMLDLYDNDDVRESGVAWLPNDDMTASNLARVVYNGRYIGLENTNENFRSVLTHEFGHYLGLNHTFYQGCTDSNDDDGVLDTPKKTNGNSASKGSLNCKDEVMNVENFMDYTDYYAMFTKGQVGRMTSREIGLRHTGRSSLWTEENLEATGIANDDELGPFLELSSYHFNESQANDGSTKDSVHVFARNGAKFLKTGNLSSGTDFTVSNLNSESLAVQIEVTSENEAVVRFEGALEAHQAENLLSNIEIHFDNSVVSGDGKDLLNKSVSPINIHFRDASTEYCIPRATYGAYYTYISRVKFKDIDQRSENPLYSDYSTQFVAPVAKGEKIPFEITINKKGSGNTDSNIIRLWVDWNRNYEFEESERLVSYEFQVGDVVDADGNYTHSVEIEVPEDAMTGKVGIRAMVHYKNKEDGEDPCANYESGEVEDYAFQIQEPVDQVTAFFNYGPNRVNLSTPVYFIGLSQSIDSDPINAWEWTFEGGEPASFSGKTPPSVIYPNEGTYSVKLKVTTKSGATSEFLIEDAVESVLEYCSPVIDLEGYSSITHVKFKNIDNESEKTNVFTNYINTKTTEVIAGEAYPLSMTINRGKSLDAYENRIRIWADWNKNSIYEEDELVDSFVYANSESDSEGNFIYTTTIPVPFDAVESKVGMRVMTHYVQAPYGDDPCAYISSGEVEDYGLIIQPGSGFVSSNFTSDIQQITPTQFVQFEDLSQTAEGEVINNWEWTFEGGKPATYSGQTPPPVQYQEEGRYNVSLQVTTEGGEQKTLTKNKFVTVKYILCEFTTSFGGYSNIKNVKFGTIDHTTANIQYQNYINSQKTNGKIGETMDLSVTVNSGNSGEADPLLLRVWADWNYNAVFDENEQLFTKNIIAGAKYSDQTFNIPVTISEEAMHGRTVALRVQVIINLKEDPIVNGCGAAESGETEDYGIIIFDENAGILADFISNKTELVESYTVEYSDQSVSNIVGVDITNWEWTFEGGEPSSYEGQNPPAITYNSRGSYGVKLVVTDSEGDIHTIEKEDYVVVNKYGHCAPTIGFALYSTINKVEIGDISFENGNTGQFHDLIETENTDISPGQTLELTVTANSGDSGIGDSIRVMTWADWNYNGIYDEHEFIGSDNFKVENKQENTPFTYQVTAPLSAKAGKTVGLRVTVHYLKENDKAIDPCKNFESGEVEDYGLNIGTEIYCAPEVLFTGFAGITHVILGDLDHQTEAEALSSSYFANQSTAVSAGNVYPISIKVNKGTKGDLSYQNRIRIWADWNKNMEYDENELVESYIYSNSKSDENGDFIYHGYMHTPIDAPVGETGLRVMVHYYFEGGTYGDNPCEEISSGEVEDYLLNIQPAEGTSSPLFTVEMRDLSIQQMVTFENLSKPLEGTTIENWEWVFEGGEPSSFSGETPPEILYSEEGVYAVSLTTTDSKGFSKTLTKENYIAVRYNLCETSAGSNYSFIQNVSFGKIKNTTTSDSYSNFINSQIETVYKGESFEVSVTTNTGNSGSGDPLRLRAWVDWNHNATLDEGELVNDESFQAGETNSTDNFIFNITPPVESVNGKKVAMRFMLNYNNDPEIGTMGCGSIESGEIEDYGLFVLGGQYCKPEITYSGYAGIVGVSLGDMENQSDPENKVTNFMTTKPAKVVAGSTYPLTVKVNKGVHAYPSIINRIRIWADWNNDFEFGEDEVIESHLYSNTQSDEDGNYTYSSLVTIPLSVDPSFVGFRVMVHYSGETYGDLPCEIISSGEVEDYALDIQPAMYNSSPAFVTETSMVNINQEVTINNLSETINDASITSWEWTFEGGEPSSFSGETPPVILYKNPGVYDVSLTITDSENIVQTLTKEDYIKVEYTLCDINMSGKYAFIKQVQYGTVDNTTENNSYQSYILSQISEGKIGEKMTFAITTNTGSLGVNDPVQFRVWADWNYNTIIEEGELLYDESFIVVAQDEDKVFTFMATIPDGAMVDKTIALRVMLNYKSNTKNGNNGCGDLEGGEVEDYGLTILPRPITIVPNFSVQPRVVAKGGAITFTDESTIVEGTDSNIDSWEWAFEGGTPSTFSGQTPPAVQYSEIGEYKVSLTISQGSEVRMIEKINAVKINKYGYCEPLVKSSDFAYIQQVTIGAIDNTTDNSGQYNDFIDTHKTDVEILKYATLTVKVNTENTDEDTSFRLTVWADWNANRVFEEGELVGSEEVTVSGSNTEELVTFDVLAPLGAAIGETANLRILLNSTDQDSESTCADITVGEIEDYGLTILEANEAILGTSNRRTAIYPNPTKGILHLSIEGNFEVEVYSLNGVLVFKGENAQSIDLSHLKSGAYFVVLKNEKEVIRRKVILK